MNLRQSRQRWLGAPLRRSLLITFSLAAGALMGILVLSARPGRPFTVKLLRVERFSDCGGNAGCPSNRITLRLSNLGSNVVFFGQRQEVRFRIDKCWSECGEPLSPFDGYVVPGGSKAAIRFLAPFHADACRLSLEFWVGRPPYCQAYFFLQRLGVPQRFPSVSRALLKCVPKQRLRHLERELALPAATPGKEARAEAL